MCSARFVLSVGLNDALLTLYMHGLTPQWVHLCVPNSHKIQGVPEKNCTKFMHHDFVIAHHSVMQFSAQCSERNLHVKG